MLNVVLVDDEVISRVGLSNMIDWEAEGYNLLKCCENGKEALEFIKINKVDIVITDIKMPIMNGLELFSSAIKLKLDCKFILLSAFDDYKYVRKALKLGAIDYLRKLELDKETLIEVLTQAKVKILKNYTSNDIRNGIDMAELIRVKRSILKELLYGHREIDSVYLKELRDNNIEFENPYFYIMLLKFQNDGNQNKEKNIIQMIEETLVDSVCAYVTWTGFDEISIIFNIENNQQSLLSLEMRRWSNRIQFIMKEYFNQNIIIYVSDIQYNIKNISMAYLQAFQAKSICTQISKDNTVYYADVIKNRDFSYLVFFKSIVKKLEQAYQANNKDIIMNVIEELIQYLKKLKYIELSNIRNFSTSVVIVTNNYLENKEINKKKFWESNQPQFELVYKFSRKVEFINYFNELKHKIEKTVGESEGNYIVKRAKEYIKLNYTQYINLQEVAKKLGITSNYLSMLYKKVTGETLKDYIIKLRIEKAKYLLRNSNDTVYEIACAVGYDNEPYFSRIFKLKTLMSPTQYRNEI